MSIFLWSAQNLRINKPHTYFSDATGKSPPVEKVADLFLFSFPLALYIFFLFAQKFHSGNMISVNVFFF